jgi:hypothetical protein
MKKIRPILCAVALALSLSPTVLAGNIHGVKATSDGNIHGGKTASSDIDAITSDLLIDVLVAVAGNIHG